MKSPEKVINYIVNWLKEYAINNNINGFVVGVSGGVDSALTSLLCAKTNLPVLCLEMRIHQEKNQISRGLNHINWLKNKFNNVKFKSIPLTNVFDAFKNTITENKFNEKELLSLANTRSRIRMMTLYYFSTLNNYLVAGTGNKVEDFGIGFYTKYGDGGVDISPIADLLKSEVYILAKRLGVLKEIIEASPTDGLWNDNRSDEEQIGATYKELESVMKNKLKNLKKTKRELEVTTIFNTFNSRNKHKMVSIPICKIPNKLKS